MILDIVLVLVLNLILALALVLVMVLNSILALILQLVLVSVSKGTRISAVSRNDAGTGQNSGKCWLPCRLKDFVSVASESIMPVDARKTWH